jgi:hypothetical protein
MRILGAGLSKTGTTSLARALTTLGFGTIHGDKSRLRSVVAGADNSPDFRVYDDIDAVTDVPTAYFYEELLEAYPGLRVILTTRAEDAWWQSIQHHFNVRYPISQQDADDFRFATRNLIYGSVVAKEYLFRKKFREHNSRVIATVPADQLLVMDVTNGDGWGSLCEFVDRPVPPEAFPHANRTRRAD